MGDICGEEVVGWEEREELGSKWSVCKVWAISKLEEGHKFGLPPVRNDDEGGRGYVRVMLEGSKCPFNSLGDTVGGEGRADKG